MELESSLFLFQIPGLSLRLQPLCAFHLPKHFYIVINPVFSPDTSAQGHCRDLKENLELWCQTPVDPGCGGEPLGKAFQRAIK